MSEPQSGLELRARLLQLPELHREGTVHLIESYQKATTARVNRQLRESSLYASGIAKDTNGKSKIDGSNAEARKAQFEAILASDEEYLRWDAELRDAELNMKEAQHGLDTLRFEADIIKTVYVTLNGGMASA